MGLFVRHEFDRVIDGLVVANGNYQRDGLGNRFGVDDWVGFHEHPWNQLDG